jgi:hypothetical protein
MYYTINTISSERYGSSCVCGSVLKVNRQVAAVKVVELDLLVQPCSLYYITPKLVIMSVLTRNIFSAVIDVSRS